MGKRARDGQSQKTRLRADVSASRFRLTRLGSRDSGVWNVASVEMFWIWTCLRGWFASWWSSKDLGLPVCVRATRAGRVRAWRDLPGQTFLCHAVLRLTASCCRMKSFHSNNELPKPCWYRKLRCWGFPMHHHTSCVQQYSMHRPICTITLRGKKSTTLMASFHKPNSGSDPASVLAASVAFLNRVYFILYPTCWPRNVIWQIQNCHNRVG